MTMKIKGFLFLILTFLYLLLSSNSFAQELQPEVKVLNKRIEVGDKIQYEITLKAPNDLEFRLEDWEGVFEGFSVKDFGEKHSSGFFSDSHKWWFVLDTYLSGDYEIAGLAINYKNKDATEWKILVVEPLDLKVDSLFNDSQAEDIKDIHSPVSEIRYMKVFIVLALILLLILIAGWFYWLMFIRAKQQTIILVPPHVKALEALERLKQRSLQDNESFKNYFYDLSLIVRVYIEDRFMVKAPEMTTEEFLVYVNQGSVLEEAHKKSLSGFLSLADMVKFAKYISTQTEVDQSYVSVKGFIEETAEKEQEPDDL